MRTVLFFRRLRGLTGGHLKVWDYFGHTLASGTHTARVLFTKDSVWTDANPWLHSRQYVVASRGDVRPDILFLGGLDWEFLDRRERARSPVPVLNVVAHVRHGDPLDPRFAFLSHRAIRICVSQEVADAIRAHTTPEGPVVVIPNGVSVAGVTEPATRDIDVLVAALKQPETGRRVAARLAAPGRTVRLLDGRLPRAEYLALVARSKAGVFLPNPTEGFYLPALEAMALGTLVVCPDAVGNRGFCTDGVNMLLPKYDDEALAAAALRALAMPAAARDALIAAGRATAARHGLDEERRTYLELLRKAPELW